MYVCPVLATPPRPPRLIRLLSVSVQSRANLTAGTPGLSFSRLDGTAFVLPVYASHAGSPQPHARLGSGGRQLCRVGLVPTGFRWKVSAVFALHRFLLLPGFACRTRFQQITRITQIKKWNEKSFS